MVNQANKKSKESGKKYLIDVFTSIHTAFLHELESHKITHTHDGMMGEATEESWINLLRKYLPNRYGVESAKIVDSKGHVSEQIDVVIFDPQYTPALYGDKIRYLPRESVYAVFEVKQNITKDSMEYAGNKVASVRDLACTSAAITSHSGDEPLKGKKPFEVLGVLLATEADWSDGLGEIFHKHLPQMDDIMLDFVFTAKHGVYVKNEPNVLKGDANLIQGLFKFLSTLNSLGTVPSIDWTEYDKVFENSNP